MPRGRKPMPHMPPSIGPTLSLVHCDERMMTALGIPKVLQNQSRRSCVVDVQFCGGNRSFGAPSGFVLRETWHVILGRRSLENMEPARKKRPKKNDIR